MSSPANVCLGGGALIFLVKEREKLLCAFFKLAYSHVKLEVGLTPVSQIPKKKERLG